VQDWKRVYKDLSQAIRNDRRGWAIMLAKKRAIDPTAELNIEDIRAANANRTKTYARLKEVTGMPFWNPSKVATKLLAIRNEEKARSWQARQERLNAAIAA